MLTDVVEPEWVGKWKPLTPGFGGVVRVECLVEDPPCKEQAENVIRFRQRFDEQEDHDMSNAFGELPVVHCAHAWDKPE
jgi:hypothetical protein